ncbi:Uma2 family endonuclease [Planosporangium thailandense]|uniref:Uma2 family endonuclease n=1 Tax=Planosporangium thailandense TaxID=765197 RepID=A0ABX0XT12_9ACTN|nr:Uma2 family endonuclease [Planosporangium thailandense]NJC68928.1 Uma2 family endonuclease [Planosporangium thailandense]
MTVDTSPLALPRYGEPWTVDDLKRLPPDNTMKYEIIDGSLVVSPRADVYHNGIAAHLCRLLTLQAPRHLLTSMESGVAVRGGMTYYEPDALLAVAAAFKQRDADHLDPSDVLIVVEVLSKYNRRHDLVTKRHYYAVAGIPQYWIADPDQQTLTVLTLADDGSYAERAVVRPGEQWKSDEPFPLTVDPAEIF